MNEDCGEGYQRHQSLSDRQHYGIRFLLRDSQTECSDYINKGHHHPLQHKTAVTDTRFTRLHHTSSLTLYPAYILFYRSRANPRRLFLEMNVIGEDVL